MPHWKEKRRKLGKDLFVFIWSRPLPVLSWVSRGTGGSEFALVMIFEKNVHYFWIVLLYLKKIPFSIIKRFEKRYFWFGNWWSHRKVKVTRSELVTWEAFRVLRVPCAPFLLPPLLPPLPKHTHTQILTWCHMLSTWKVLWGSEKTRYSPHP